MIDLGCTTLVSEDLRHKDDMAWEECLQEGVPGVGEGTAAGVPGNTPVPSGAGVNAGVDGALLTVQKGHIQLL